MIVDPSVGAGVSGVTGGPESGADAVRAVELPERPAVGCGDARGFRGGRTSGFDSDRIHGILYHRHVSSVVAREWSRCTDLFINSSQRRRIADYIRPTAAQSDYLDADLAGVPPRPSTSGAR